MGLRAFFSGLAERANRNDQLDERAFLPAALEVVETPPSPTGRALLWIIIIFFVIALAWAILGRVDIQATATGRIIPSGETKTIQPLNAGVIKGIYVRNGQHVRAGDLLIALDPTQTGAERDQAADALIAARLDVVRLQALWQAAETGHVPQFVAPPDIDPNLVNEARAAMQAQWSQQNARLADFSEQISEKSSEAAQFRAQSDEINASTPLLLKKEHIHQELTEQGYGTSLAYLDAQQQVIQAQHEVSAQSEHANQSLHARAALESEREEARAQFAANTLSDLHKAQEQVDDVSQDLVKAQNRSNQNELRSPIDGVVDQLTVHTSNGVVTPAQPLMIVVPDSRDLMVEARLADQDVGFVHPGQPANIKVETFNFTRYGLIKGQVTDVSHDVITADPRRDQGDQGAAPSQAQQPAYVVRIALAQTGMMVDGRRQLLQPGMAVTVEVKTGQRTIIDYLLSPLAKKAQESMHER
jgi:hemolysin D